MKQHASTLAAGADVSINAAKDITLNSSAIAGANVALNAGENINITAANDREFMDVQTHNKSTFSSSSKRDMTLKENVVSSSIDGNNISITSGKDTVLQAANLKAAQNIQVDAAGDINILAQAYREASLHQESKSSFGGLVSSASLDSMDAIKLREATVKTEAKNIIMNSGKDITVVASNVSAGDALVLASTGDTNIVSGQEISQSEHWSKKSGFFSGGGNIYSSEFDLKSNADITAKASTVDGKAVTINSGNDINVKGSAIVGENDVAINAGKNLTIESANERHTSEEVHESSGFGIYGSSGGLGFTIGQQDKKDALSSDATLQSQSRSLVGSINGDLALNATDSVAVKGSDLVAGNDMSIQAKNVTLQESEDATKTKETHELRQSGLTVALTGSVVSAAQTANQMNQASQKTDNLRLKALAAMTTGLGALSAYGDVAGGGTNAIGVSATIGNTQSKSESTSQSLVHSGSSATAGGDISIIATGDGANSDITISGSDIAAGKNITLSADDAITLTASQDTYSNRSSSSSSSGGVGVAATVGTGGGQLGFTANASMGRGRTNGDDALINNTHITANDTLTISSGGDTTLKGATAKADTIKADVGGDLAIESLQGTSTYASKSQNVGGSVTVGWGGASGSVSYSQTDVKSDYASVNEQSGIQAGDGGFQINVGKNTDLKGGVISSNQSAIENNKNSITTATLTTSDINNHADYKASSVSVSVGSDAGGVNISGAGAGFDKGSASGETKSAISSATVTITDDAKQLSLTGKTAQDTIASINTDTTNANQKINQIFDASKVTGEVEATAQIMQSFTQYAPKAVADYASAKASELRKQGKDEEAKKWDEGGAYRIALHTVSGALGGGVGGAVGAATAASSAPLLESFQNSTTQALIDVGMSSDSAATIASGLTSITAAGMGALTGSTTGEAGTLNGAATAYTTDANNRQLHNQEIRWIKNHAKEYAQKTGLTPEQAEALLIKAAMYYVDEGASDALTQKQKDAGFLSLNPYDQSQYAQAYNYMRANSKGEYFTDVYNEDKITKQPFFTATKAQYANSSYTPSLSPGLVDESLVVLPTIKAVKETAKITPESVSKIPAIVNQYDPKLLYTGTGVAGGMSYIENSSKYSGTELATHIGTDMLVSYIAGKVTPIADGWKVILYGVTSGGISSSSSEYLHQNLDIFNNRSDTINWYDVKMNAALDGTGAALGKTFKIIGDTASSPRLLNDVIDLTTSTAFKPIVKPIVENSK